MRIRRRPPGQPLAYLLPSDPRAPQPPPAASADHQQRPAGEDKRDLHPNAAADLGGHRRSSTATRPALLSLLPPQDAPLERGRGLQGAQQREGPADARHRSLENGHRHVPEPMIMAGDRVSNGGIATMVAASTTIVVANATTQQGDGRGGGGGSGKKPRGPGVLMEGSRCSRKNGRGWRCSQPTLVGYALCQYHLGKGRSRSGGAAAGRSGAGQLGRTENGKRASTAAPPKADVPLLLPPPPPKADVPLLPPPKADVPLPPPPPPPSVQQW